MLHFMFICNNVDDLNQLKVLKDKNGDDFAIQLKAEPVWSYDNNLKQVSIEEKRMVNMVFKPVYLNEDSLSLSHLDVAKKYLPNTFKLKVGMSDPTYILTHNGKDYTPIHYVSEFGDWLYPYKHIRSVKGAQEVHQKLILNGLKVMGIVISSLTLTERFMQVVETILGQYKENPKLVLKEQVFNGELMDILNGLDVIIQEFLTALIGYHYHYLNLRFNEIEKLKELVDWNHNQLSDFFTTCGMMIKLQTPAMER